MKLPKGFRAAGRNLGIKNRKPDAGLILADQPCPWAAVLTRNACRAPNIDRLERLRGRGAARAVLAVSGNANALTGAGGAEDDARLAGALAERLGVSADEVLTSYTGIIGRPLPVERIEGGLGKLLADLGSDPVPFAESILTTDRVTKVVERELYVGGRRVRVVGIVKGAGMIAPSMATMLGYVLTDAKISSTDLQAALSAGNRASFDMLTVDNDMSTNDLVIAMASGAEAIADVSAGSSGGEAFIDAVREVMVELARAIASDGEGATRRFEVQVDGAPTEEQARVYARAVANSPLVKTAVFGGDPNAGGRIAAAAGAAAASHGLSFALEHLRLHLQGVPVVEGGEARAFPVDARARLTEDVVVARLSLGEGAGSALAFGCDLSFEYVSINADYAGVTLPGAAEPEEEASLSTKSPEAKRALLVEALRYIHQFRGMRAVIKIGGAAMVEPVLEQHFAESVLLLRSVGLRPIVVHGGGPEISRSLERLGQEARFVDGLRVTDAEAMKVVEMVLTGSVNQRLVAAFNHAGARDGLERVAAVGISGKDGGLIKARPHATEALGRVGEVASIDPRVLDLLERDGFVPVVSPVGLGDDGGAYNINADVAAARLAAAVGAAKLIYLSDVPGLLQGEGEVVSELNGDQLKVRLESGEITGGMKPKLESALEALRAGVGSVHLVDGRVPHNLVAELFTDKGVGTLIRQA